MCEIVKDTDINELKIYLWMKTPTNISTLH